MVLIASVVLQLVLSLTFFLLLTIKSDIALHAPPPKTPAGGRRARLCTLLPARLCTTVTEFIHVQYKHYTFIALQGAPARAARVSLSPNGTLLATVPGKEAVIQLWDVSSGTPRSVLEGHKHAVTAVAFSPSGKNLASGGKDGTVMLWDMTAATPERRATLSGHTRAITAVAWRPGGGVLASASADLTVRVWNTARGECTGSFNFRHMPEPIAWGASGGNAFTLAVGQQANVWVAETHTGERHNACTGHLGNVQGVAFSPNGATLATASSDCTVRLFDVWYGGPRFRKELVGHKAWVTAVAFSPSGHTIASASEDKTIIIWNASTGARLSTLRSHQGAIYDIAFDRSGRLLASAGTDATLLWCRPV